MIKESTDIFKFLNFEFILEFFKYIIPIILTIWGVLYLRKSRFYYIERNNIKLYDDIVKKVKGISIKYNNNDVNENLILFNGTIILKSHNDIKSEDIDKELVIFSPDSNAMWKDFEITNTSLDFKPKFMVDKNKIIIEKTLLKSNDFISFTGMLDSKNTNLNVGHRIYNIIPRSINFKENELDVYKFTAVFLTIISALVLGFYTYTKYNESKREELRQLKTTEKRNKKDSLNSRFYDYNIKYFIKNHEISIDSLKASYRSNTKNKYKIIEEKNDKELDSLTRIFHRNRTDKNELLVLRKLLENMKTSFSKFDSPYDEIEKASEKKLKNLISKNQIMSGKKYQINDSVEVLYNDYTIINYNSDDKKTNFYYFDSLISFLGYILVLSLLSMMTIQWFRYFRLSKIINIYKNKNGG